MEKIMTLAAVAALVFLPSCQKEEAASDSTGTSPVFTASINDGAVKTSVDVSNGKVAWESDDVITVTDGASVSAIYKIESIDATTGRATFVIKSGETALGAGPYSATYGADPATVQTYSATAGKLYMTAPETSCNSFEFSVRCGLMKLNLTKADESVKSITVTNSENTIYTLTCTDAQSIASARDFYIALPAGSYTKIEVINASDEKCTLNAKKNVAIKVNTITPVTIVADKIHFRPAGALSGVFTVDSNGTMVHFSQGNLWCDGNGTFYFEDNQYDTTPATAGTWDPYHVSHFYWSKNAKKAYAEAYDDPEQSKKNMFFTNQDVTTAKSDFSVNGVIGKYRTLSMSEWKTLLVTRTKKCGVTVCGMINCLIIAPDDWTGEIKDKYDETTSPTWAEAQATGLVCLPAAGRRKNGSEVVNGTPCYYWTSSPDEYNSAFCIYFNSTTLYSNSNVQRNYGCCIRLVTDVK